MKKVILSFMLTCGLFADTIIVNDPNDTIYVDVSEHSMNRIVFPNTIISKEYSKEKGLIVKTFENEAFLKWTPQVEETSFVSEDGKPIQGQPQQQQAKNDSVLGDKKVVYDKAEPAEVYFVTEGKTYSVIFKPADIGPRTVMINETIAKKKDIILYETKDAYKETMKKIAFDVHNGNVPYGYEEIDDKITYKSKTIEAKREKVYRGTLYKATKYTIINKGAKPLSLDEREYINLAEKEPLFLSFFSKKQLRELPPLDEASLVVIERGGE